MRINDITKFLESFAPTSLQESYDNSGLIVGSNNHEVNKVLVTLDITEEVLEEAIAEKCDMIVAHHPMVFKGLKRFNGSDLTERLVIKAIKSDIAIYAIHTNLDNVSGGVNGILAERLGLKNTKILLPKNEGLRKIVCFCPTEQLEKVQSAMFDAGAGHIGNYDSCSYYGDGTGTFRALDGSNPFVGNKNELHHENEKRIETIVPDYKVASVISAMIAAHPYEEPAYDIYKLENPNNSVGSGMIGVIESEMPITEYLNFVKKTLGTKFIKHNRLIDRPVKKVAICGGSGSFLINTAARQNADLFISADIKYHDFFEHLGKMTIADAGHFETEQPVKELIYALLKKKFPNFALQISKVGGNPVSFL